MKLFYGKIDFSWQQRGGTLQAGGGQGNFDAPGGVIQIWRPLNKLMFRQVQGLPLGKAIKIHKYEKEDQKIVSRGTLLLLVTPSTSWGAQYFNC